MKRYLPFVVFITGLCIALYYAYSTNYITVYDAGRGYDLYNYYRTHSAWEPMQGLYGLQNTAVFTNYLPAYIQEITHLNPDTLFKVYIAIGIAFVPVIAYFIARKYVGSWYALFASLFVMGWVAFYQGGSFARSNFAMILYGGLILVMLSNWRRRYKYPVSALLVGSLAFAHYGAALITAAVLFGIIGLSLIRKKWRYAKYVGVVVLILLISSGYWHGVVNQETWKYINLMIEDTRQMAKMGVGVDELQGLEGEGIEKPFASLASRDKIIQAAFGTENPDNDTEFTLNRWMLLFAWFTVVLMSYGAYRVLRDGYPTIYKWMVVLSFCAIALTVLIPQVSRGYGIEKVYYQAIMVTAPCLIIGGQDIVRRIRIPAWVLLSGILLPYTGLMWKYGVIHSILG